MMPSVGSVLDTLEALMAAVYAAREGPPPVDPPAEHAPLLAALRAVCENHQGMNDYGSMYRIHLPIMLISSA